MQFIYLVCQSLGTDNERYQIDRTFDHSGRVCVIVSPGQGVFEVDRELAVLTRQRTIDLGLQLILILQHFRLDDFS